MTLIRSSNHRSRGGFGVSFCSNESLNLANSEADDHCKLHITSTIPNADRDFGSSRDITCIQFGLFAFSKCNSIQDAWHHKLLEHMSTQCGQRQKVKIISPWQAATASKLVQHQTASSKHDSTMRSSKQLDSVHSNLDSPERSVRKLIRSVPYSPWLKNCLTEGGKWWRGSDICSSFLS